VHYPGGWTTVAFQASLGGRLPPAVAETGSRVQEFARAGIEPEPQDTDRGLTV